MTGGRGTAAFALVDPAAALKRVGATSAADGDPQDKPPASNEHILRIGVDVPATEAVTTIANDRAFVSVGATSRRDRRCKTAQDCPVVTGT